MDSIRTVGLMLLTLFAFSAVAATPSQAEGPIYKVNGKTLKAGETRLLLATAKEAFKLKSTGAGITLKCEALKLPQVTQMQVQGVAAGNGGVSKEVIEFTGCTQEGNGVGCTVENERVRTTPLLNLLGWGNASETGQVLVLFEPETNKTFAALNFVGETCKFPTGVVEGTVIGGVQVGGAPVLGGQGIETSHGEVKFPHVQLIFVLRNSVLSHVKAGWKFFGIAATIEGIMLLTVDEGSTPVKWGVFG